MAPPLTDRIVLEPSQWADPISDWTFSAIRAAMAQADHGDLEAAADLCEAMLEYDRIIGTLNVRVSALLGLNNSISTSFEADKQQTRELISRDWWLISRENELRKLMIWALELGIGLAYVTPIEFEGRWVPTLTAWNPRFLEYDLTTRTYKVRTENQGTIEIKENDPHWLFYLPFGKTRPWAQGLWKALSLYWFVARKSWISWGKHNDLYGSGAVVGELPPGVKSDSPQAGSFYSQLLRMGKNARVVFEDGYKLDILEAKADTWQTFRAALEDVGTAVAIEVLGQRMSTENPANVSTGAQAAAAVRKDILKYDVEQFISWAHESVLKLWASWNSKENDVPWIRLDTTPEESRTPAAASLNSLGLGLAQLEVIPGIGENLDKRVILERYGLPIREGAVFGGGGSVAVKPPEPVKPTAPVSSIKPVDRLPRAKMSALKAALPSDAWDAGQAYADVIAADGRDSTGSVLSEYLQGLLRIIDGVEDGPDWEQELRAKVIAYYASTPMSGMAQILEHAMILANLAGRAAVSEESGG